MSPGMKKDVPTAAPALPSARPEPLKFRNPRGRYCSTIKNVVPAEYASRPALRERWSCISSPDKSIESEGEQPPAQFLYPESFCLHRNMSNYIYEPRTYRNQVHGTDLVSFGVTIKETDLFIRARKNLRNKAERLVEKYRNILEKYIGRYPDFLTTLEPFSSI